MARRNENYPPLSMGERAEVLGKFHPDYQPSGKRTVEVDPNKGDTYQERVADLLESRSLIRPGKVNLGKIDHETDVLVIGGGGAGTSAALMAAAGEAIGGVHGENRLMGNSLQDIITFG